MASDGQKYLPQAVEVLPPAFQDKVREIAARLDLDKWLDETELNALSQAAYYGTLCNIAFNGLGGCQGEIRPDREGNRMRIEREFMAARNRLWETAGWQALPEIKKGPAHRIFLNVYVVEGNLAR